MKNLIAAVALAVMDSACSRSDTAVGDSELTAKTPSAPGGTEVFASLETPIPNGKNAVWCASFLAAWKTLADRVAPEPLALAGAGELTGLFNRSPDPRPAIPPGALLVAAGWKQQGVVEAIQKDFAQRFPSRKPPTFPEVAPEACIAYSYLEASVKFSLPYFQNLKALEFTDSAGRKTPIFSFGIRPGDEIGYYKLRAQPRILFRKGDERNERLEFALDLCADSNPSQIVVARINREPTLAAALARVERESIEMQKRAHADPADGRYQGLLYPNDVLLVPNLYWRLSHRFSELEGRGFANAKLKGQRLDVARQDIVFRLNRSGVELKSESTMSVNAPPTYYALDRPFLIYMKQRGSKNPYLAMWIDNGELLSHWP